MGLVSANWIDPVVFATTSHRIYWYGVWFAAGFLAAVFHWSWLARRDGRRAGFGADFGFFIVLAGVLGARMAYALSHWAEFAQHPTLFIRLDRGGLIFYGGFIAATLTVFVIARITRQTPLALLDFAVTGLALGHALGRVGCFFNGCCYGVASNLPWACLSAGEYRHPVQLYEAAFNLALWIGLTRLYLRRVPHGVVFAAYLVAYGLWRFSIEFLRGDERLTWLALHAAQWISLASVAAGAILWLALARRVRRRPA